MLVTFALNVTFFTFGYVLLYGVQEVYRLCDSLLVGAWEIRYIIIIII